MQIRENIFFQRFLGGSSGSPDFDETLWTAGKFDKQFGAKEKFKFDRDSNSFWSYSENEGLWKWSGNGKALSISSGMWII